jgi:PAS domain S-box-containing protein
MPLPFSKLDGTPIWCSLTTKAILDSDGEVVFLDGLVRDITGEIEESSSNDVSFDRLNVVDAAVLSINPQGRIMATNTSADEIFGRSGNEAIGCLFSDFLAKEDQQLFFLFLGDAIRIGREEIILKLDTASSDKRYIQVEAAVVKTEGRARKINCVVCDVTERVKQIKEKTNRTKFQGVLEMAGGVAHRFNQPLTIVTNIINEVMIHTEPEDKLYQSMVKMQMQINKLNDITRKIGNIKKYEAVDYVAGVKIVDIDRAS